MTYNLQIIRKPVKNLRIRVVNAQTVQAVAPKLMSRMQIEQFLDKKKAWIHKQIEKHIQASTLIQLDHNQLLLHGEAYTVLCLEWQWNAYTIDHKRKFVWRGHDLTDTHKQTHRYKTYAKKILSQRLDYLSQQHNISYDKCFIRDQKTKRWSCSSKGNIGLNRRLVKMPERVMDYIINHELAHRLHMDHSQKFRDACTALFPKTKEARKRLKEYGRALH